MLLLKSQRFDNMIRKKSAKFKRDAWHRRRPENTRKTHSEQITYNTTSPKKNKNHQN